MAVVTEVHLEDIVEVLLVILLVNLPRIYSHPAINHNNHNHKTTMEANPANRNTRAV